MRHRKDWISWRGLNLEYSYTPEVPGVYSAAPEDCYPTEPAEVEILTIEMDKPDVFALYFDDADPQSAVDECFDSIYTAIVECEEGR